MGRLRITAFAARGGDWGTLTTEDLVIQAPPALLGRRIHTSCFVSA
jgi:hypothetical protein